MRRDNYDLSLYGATPLQDDKESHSLHVLINQVIPVSKHLTKHQSKQCDYVNYSSYDDFLIIR